MISSSHPRVHVERLDDAKSIQVRVNGELFTSYLYPDTIMKPVLYPVVSEAGNRVTRGFPLENVAGERVDHPHHIGIWMNFGDVNGLDFWNHSEAVPAERKEHFGTIRHREILDMREEGSEAHLTVSADWLRPGGSPLLSEKTTFRFCATAGVRIIDRTSVLTAVQEDVLFQDNKEGLMAIRVARGLEHPSEHPEILTDAKGHPQPEPEVRTDGVSGRFFSSEGVEGEAVWSTRGPWMTLAGRLEEEEVSVILLDHPSNPGYPTHWHARGYGLFAANPFGQAAMHPDQTPLNFRLTQSESVTLQYRVVIHSGPRPSNHDIRRIYSRFGTDIGVS